MLVSKEMDQEKDQAKLPMLMEVFMMESGSTIKKMEMASISILMILNIMESGRKIFERGMELINILMEIDMKVTGAMIFRVELEPITILMGIFTRVNGLMEGQMEKAIIFIMEIRECIRATGRTEKKKALENWSLMINMDTLVNGKTIRKMGEDHTFIQTVSVTKEIGLEIRRMEEECTNTGMEMFMMVTGKMIVDRVMAQ